MDTAHCPASDVALSTLACLQTEDLRKHLPDIHAPALVVHGEQDEICLNEGGVYLADAIPGARKCMLPNTGHMPFITRREHVVESVLDFLMNTAEQAAQNHD